MSNHNRNINNQNGNGNQGTPGTTGNGGKEKESFIKKAIGLRDRVMASKIGRGVVRGLKALGVGGLVYVSYKAGVKSVKPTTVYIREGVTEEEEPATEEVITEPDTIDDIGEAE